MATRDGGRRAGGGLLLALGLGLALGAPTGAAAETVRGRGLVVAKDLGESTVRLAPGALLHVEEHTRILDADGLLLPLVALEVARKEGPMVEGNGDAMVRYEASREGGKLVAERIRVLGEIPR